MSGLLAIGRRLRDGEDAATTAEYALVLSLIAAACIATISALSTSLNGPFQRVTTTLSS